MPSTRCDRGRPQSVATRKRCALTHLIWPVFGLPNQGKESLYKSRRRGVYPVRNSEMLKAMMNVKMTSQCQSAPDAGLNELNPVPRTPDTV